MRVLITGIAGFIGSNLAEYLISKGYEIIGIDNLSYGLKEQIPNKARFHCIDIRSKDIYKIFKGVDYIFHLAAKNCINDCQNDPFETVDINITGTINVFETARRASIKKVIYAESSAMYEGSKLIPTPEYDIHPKSFYALSKLSSMYFASAYKRYYGLNTTALRYFNVYGPRQDYRRNIPPVISAFIINLLSGKRPIVYGDGKKRRDFIYIDDVNRFHELLLYDNHSDDETYNVGTSINYSILEIYDAIESILRTGIKPIFKPELPGEAFQNLADITKAKSLGWEPKVSLEDGLKLSIVYIKKLLFSDQLP